jgi:hypothetical protein
MLVVTRILPVNISAYHSFSLLLYMHLHVHVLCLCTHEVQSKNIHLLYFRVGRFASLGVLYGCDTLAMCRACECISEMVEFLNSDREHMQQGIFPDVQQSCILHSALNFDEVSLKL